MKTITAFFRLIRWPNLIFIVLTQALFRYYILPFVYQYNHSDYENIKLSQTLFILLSLASVCIAAAGYIINDYFDVNIDQVNKSSKVIIGRYIKRRYAILFHALLSLAGLILSLYIGYKINNIYIPVFNFIAIVLLWFYSTTFKKKLLIGNILISLLTAWVILVMTVAEYRFRISPHDIVWQRLLKVSFVYAGFAFIISLIREVIKDMEDIQGDLNYGCKTMPIVWGLPVSKVFAGVWIIVLTGLIAAIQIYAIQLGWWYSALYSLFTIIIPLIWILRKLYEAATPEKFHQLSTMVKLIMLTGIISMIFFKYF
ncbi:MAG: geranylgeranylglycerol-phosphate geranylgeranyltransferase [Bacteroidota bacterium]|nr:geranylgeranylglycerol-phosphate geranylgeranyltransferase [Bacteroidota bacterium]